MDDSKGCNCVGGSGIHKLLSGDCSNDSALAWAFRALDNTWCEGCVFYAVSKERSEHFGQVRYDTTSNCIASKASQCNYIMEKIYG